MPNFHIPDKIQDHLIRQAEKVSNRPVELALGGFPLTVAQIQASVLAQDQFAAMYRLREEEGIATIERHREIRLALLRNANLPGINRSVVVYLHLPEGIFVGRATMYSIPVTKFDVSENHYLIPDFSHLDDSERQELTTWVERCVRQERLQEIVMHCAAKVLREHAPTTSHLHALWPEITALIDPEEMNFTSEKDYIRKWVERLRNPARRNYAAYKPDPAVRATYARLIEAANTQLAAGMILKDYQWRRGQIRASLEHWERLDRDLRLPE
jgi:hypothetical protein